MSALARVTAVEHLGGRALRVSFTDGAVRELDFAGVLDGVLEILDNDQVFATVEVDRFTGTVSWRGVIDLDPDVLHGDAEPASGKQPRLIRQYRLEHSA